MALHYSLSIANASFQPFKDQSDDGNGGTFTFNADFQDVSSYMNPDIATVVGIKRPHIGFMDGLLPHDLFERLAQTYFAEVTEEDLGVPLLLPLTFSVEFEQKTVTTEPTSRSIAISVDPVSVLLSYEDVKLLRAVVGSWTKTKNVHVPIERKHVCFYDVTFVSERLGLGLRKENDRVVVDNVADSKNHESIHTGDALFAINSVGILDVATITLGEMVSRLSSEPRPLTLTFSREFLSPVNNGLAKSSYVEKKTHEGVIDKVNISMSSAVVTVVENELPLIQASVKTTKFSCNVVRSTVVAVRFELSSGISVDYYNLRIWGWEPFVDPGVLFLSSSYQDMYHGPKELSIEIGDRDAGLSINVTDAFMETLSRIVDWRNDVQGDKTNESEGFLFDETNETSGNAESSIRVQRDVLSQNAASAAFRFAARQKIGTTKPFVFQNRSGISVAFAMQKGSMKLRHSNESLLSLGDYNGLQQYESSEIMVLSNGEDLKFRIDVSSDETNADRRILLFPSFTVALQKTSGVTVKPFENLQTSRQGELLLPLLFDATVDSEYLASPPRRQWASWLVKQSDEKSIVSVGSSIRVVSMLNQGLEIGLQVYQKQDVSLESGNVTSLGMLREGSPFCLPLWIAMQLQSWICCVRLGTGYNFTPIFIISPDGLVILEDLHNGYVECQPLHGSAISSWLAVSLHDEGGIVLIHIDSAVSIRNLLPVSIEWEVGLDARSAIDGSIVRARALRSGEEVEILTKDIPSTKIRLRPVHGEFTWSPWTSLSMPEKREAAIYQERSTSDCLFTLQEDHYITVYVKDIFYVPLPLGLRIATKPSGVDVAVYADLWCSNCTTLDVIFGSSVLNALHDHNGPELSKPFKDLTVAEATLKEISFLFEGGDFVRSVENVSRDYGNDMIRIPGQVAPIVVEECFEYVEMQSSVVISRWWASENPFSPRECLMASDQEQCNWIDKAWVSASTFYSCMSALQLSNILVSYLNFLAEIGRHREDFGRLGVNHGS
jgi:hypothetical protein